MRIVRRSVSVLTAVLTAFTMLAVAQAPQASAEILVSWNHVYNGVTGQCLAANGNNDAYRDGARIYQYPCNQYWDDQKWFRYGQPWAGDPKYHKMENLGTHMMVGTTDGYWVTQRSVVYARDIVLVDKGNGWFMIKDEWRNLCVAIRTGDGWSNGEQAIWATCNWNYADQAWHTVW